MRALGSIATLVLVATALTTGCVDPLVTTINTVVSDENAPGGEPQPANGTLIAPDQPIVVRYTDRMATDSVRLSGADADVGVSLWWATSIDQDDTLTIAPDTVWPLYQTLSLRVDATSASGFAARPVELTFRVVDEVMHVDAARSSASPIGSPDEPYPTIAQAIAQAADRIADGFRGEQTIRVATGSYAESVTMLPGVVLEGGYAADFGSRAPGTTVLTGEPESIATVLVPAEIERSAGVTLDGFTVEQPPGGTAVASIIVAGGPARLANLTVHAENQVAVGVSSANGVVITGSTVLGPATWEGARWRFSDYFFNSGYGSRVALYAERAGLEVSESRFELPGNAPPSNLVNTTVLIDASSRVVIDRSDVLAPSDSDIATAVAVTVAGESTLALRNSLLDGGSAELVRAVLGETGTVTVRNCTIRVGTPLASSDRVLGAGIDFDYHLGGDSLGVPDTTGNSLLVQNTIIFGAGAPETAAIVHGDLAILQNNSFHDLPFASVFIDPVLGDFDQWLTAAQLNADVDVGASGNTDAIDPGLAVPLPLPDPTADWSLTAGSPLAVRDEGLDLTEVAVPAVDRSGANRPAGTWSRGAFEYE